MFLSTVQPATYEVTVNAGKVDRIQSIVSFDLPKLPDGRCNGMYLENAVGRKYPVQIHNGKGWFILEDLKAGQEGNVYASTRAA